MRKSINVSFLAVAVVLIALTVCGSLWDYEIAGAVYLGQNPGQNFFGVAFAFVGILPTFVGWSFLGASLIALIKKQGFSQAKRRTLIAFGVLLIVLSVFYFCNTLMMVNASAFSVHWAVAYPVGLAVIFGAGVLGYKMAQKSENPNLIRTVLFLAVVSLTTLLIVASTKKIMDRPRYRWAMQFEGAFGFRNWWQSGSSLKAQMGSGAISDDFSSFPSGHSTYSMFAVFLLPALAEYVTKWKRLTPLLCAVGLVWWGLTAFSRLTVGAHYLTDVAVSGLVAMLSYAGVKLILALIKRKKKTPPA